MEIRTKISLQFTLIVAVIQLLLSVAIYIAFAEARVEDLYDRFEAKAKSVGQMLMDIEEINTDLLKKIETNNPLSMPDEKVIVYDRMNRIIFTNDDKHEIKITPGLLALVRVYNRARARIGDHEVLGRLYTSGKTRIVVFVAAVDLYGFKKLAILRLILLFVFIVGLVIVYFAGRVFATRAVHPILKVMEQVDKIGASSLHERLDEGNSKDEIARLAATFNKLLERLETSFSMQKNFIANASHEMNTPLTVITGQLEVVLMKARSNQEYAETINTVLSEIRNLNQLSKKLLMLAQASSDLAGSGFSRLRIDDLLWQVRSDIVNRSVDFKVQVELQEDLDDENQLIVNGNDLLLKTALANIVENGCKYSNDHEVMVDISRNAQFLIIRISDHGIGIPEKDIPMIFQPFYRSRTAKQSEGHGIGLSLADKIIALHRGSISVSSEVGKGTVFTIRLPLAVIS